MRKVIEINMTTWLWSFISLFSTEGRKPKQKQQHKGSNNISNINHLKCNFQDFGVHIPNISNKFLKSTEVNHWEQQWNDPTLQNSGGTLIDDKHFSR